MEEHPKARRRIHFSLRTMLVLVTLLCISLSGWQWLVTRSARFEEVCSKHWFLARKAQTVVIQNQANNGTSEEFMSRVYSHRDYHMKMYKKYYHASLYPWESLSEDPPEPQYPYE